MCPARRVVDHATVPQQLSRQDRTASRRRWPAKNLWKDGVRNCPDVEPRLDLFADLLRDLSRLQRGNVVGAVPAVQRRRLGTRRGAVLAQRQPAHRPGQIHHRGHTRYPQRMHPPIAGAAIDLGADEQRGVRFGNGNHIQRLISDALGHWVRGKVQVIQRNLSHEPRDSPERPRAKPKDPSRPSQDRKQTRHLRDRRTNATTTCPLYSWKLEIFLLLQGIGGAPSGPAPDAPLTCR